MFFRSGSIRGNVYRKNFPIGKNNSTNEINSLLKSLEEGNIENIEKLIDDISLVYLLNAKDRVLKKIYKIDSFEDKNQIFKSLIQKVQPEIEARLKIPGQQTYITTLKDFKNNTGYYKALNLYNQANITFLNFQDLDHASFTQESFDKYEDLYKQSLGFYKIAEETCIANFFLDDTKKVQTLLDKIKEESAAKAEEGEQILNKLSASVLMEESIEESSASLEEKTDDKTESSSEIEENLERNLYLRNIESDPNFNINNSNEITTTTSSSEESETILAQDKDENVGIFKIEIQNSEEQKNNNNLEKQHTQNNLLNKELNEQSIEEEGVVGEVQNNIPLGDLDPEDPDNLSNTINGNNEVKMKAFTKFIGEITKFEDDENSEKETSILGSLIDPIDSIGDMCNKSIQEMKDSIAKVGKTNKAHEHTGDKGKEPEFNYAETSSSSEEGIKQSVHEKETQNKNSKKSDKGKGPDIDYFEDFSKSEEEIIKFEKRDNYWNQEDTYKPISQISSKSEEEYVSHSISEAESSGEYMSIEGLFPGALGADDSGESHLPEQKQSSLHNTEELSAEDMENLAEILQVHYSKMPELLSNVDNLHNTSLEEKSEDLKEGFLESLHQNASSSSSSDSSSEEGVNDLAIDFAKLFRRAKNKTDLTQESEDLAIDFAKLFGRAKNKTDLTQEPEDLAIDFAKLFGKAKNKTDLTQESEDLAIDFAKLFERAVNEIGPTQEPEDLAIDFAKLFGRAKNKTDLTQESEDLEGAFIELFSQDSSNEENLGSVERNSSALNNDDENNVAMPKPLMSLFSGGESDANLSNQLSSGGTSMKYKTQLSSKPSFKEDMNKLNNLLRQKDSNHNDIINLLYRIDMVALSKRTSLIKNLDDLNDESLKEKIFETLITRIDGELSKNQDATEQHHLNKLKIISLGKQAASIKQQYINEERAEIKLDKFKKVIKLYDDANILCNKALNGNTSDNPEGVFQNQIFAIISNYASENPDHAYILADQSLTARSTYLREEASDHSYKVKAFYPSLLLAMISLPYVADKTDDESLKLGALKIAEDAYSMCHMHGANLEYLAQMLKNMANLNRYFGDNLKADVQDKQAEDICSSDENAKEDYNNIYNKSNIYSPIIASGNTTPEMIEVKRAIQENILNPVSAAAANGKWQEKNYMGVDYGAGGYLTESHIKSCLGSKLASEENADANVKIALMLAFEAINLGIMNSDSKNPTCALHFVIKHPDLTKEIVKHHSDFFVSSYIFRNTIKDAHKHSHDLFGYKIEANGEYNKFFEAAITPFVLERLDASVYKPISELVKSDEWSGAIKNTMLNYISDSYLTSGVMMNSNLGANLGELPDILNIVRILAFKTINDALRDKGEPNYSPINAFAEKYLDIVERIHKEAKDISSSLKSDYFANNAVLKICETKIASAKKANAIKNLEAGEFAGDVAEQAQDVSKNPEAKVDLGSSDLFQSVLHFSSDVHNNVDDVTTLGEAAI